MTTLLQFGAFALGTYLSIRMIAALHGVVDVWHVFGKAGPRTVAGVIVWAAATGAIAWLMSSPCRSALAWGLATYLAFYLSLLPLARLYVGRRRTDRNTG